MAIFIAGMTTCPLCKHVIERENDAVNFPPLFLNQHHDVFAITDAVVHRACLKGRPYARLALAKLAAYERRRGRPKVCAICGEVISDPDEYFGTGPLADDPAEPISRLDWFEAHVPCLATWEGTSGLIRDLLEASRFEDWEGDALPLLAARLDELSASQNG